MSDKDAVFGTVPTWDDAFLAKASPEPALDPSRPIVDPHMHLWHLHEEHPYFVPHYAREISDSGHNVVATVFIECHTMYRAAGPAYLKSVGETEFAAGQGAMADSGRYGPARIAQGIVAFTDLCAGDRVEEALAAHAEAANGRLRGIRQRCKWDADPKVKGSWSADKPELYLDKDFQAGFARLASMGLSFDASIYHPQLLDVVALARRNPDASIVLIHTGSPVGHSSYRGREAENYAVWLSGMRALAACPNVTIKLGGMLMNLANYDFSIAARPPSSADLVELWRAHTEPCLDLFGADRCMVSSNFPVEKAGFSFSTLWNFFKRITAGCSEDEKTMIFSGTARRVYRLD